VVTPADQGALSISCGPPYHNGTWEYDSEYELGDVEHAAEAPHEAKDA
jgi:phosphogluconate dehydratase